MDQRHGSRATQRFRILPRGLECIASYRAAVDTASATGDRSALKTAKEIWANKFGLATDDGLVLEEFTVEGTSIGGARAALERCGCADRAVREAIQRCVAKGLLQSTHSASANARLGRVPAVPKPFPGSPLLNGDS